MVGNIKDVTEENVVEDGLNQNKVTENQIARGVSTGKT